MVSTSSTLAIADASDVAAILNRFTTLNEARLARIREALPPQQRDFFDLLPLLFHVNHALLPGYRQRESPAGVYGYHPSQAALEAATRQGCPFHSERGVQHLAPIHAIYLMGSPGSVAYSGDSDFDIWICYDVALPEEQIGQLRTKTKAVAGWAEAIGLEVHFFLVRPDQFQKGAWEALSDAGSGSAQQRLLLDEFYRTGVRVAGMYPIWWLVPPEYEAAYDSYVAEMVKHNHVPLGDFIDFGSLSHVPAEEFLGAAVWQLYKGIDSPFKSVLKLLLIESYAREYPALDLLSMGFKRAVYAGEGEVDRLDPYLMMLDKVEQYLIERNERARLTLARRCFYFKVGEGLSGDPPGRAQWRRELLALRAATWGWGPDQLSLLDSRHTWKVDRVSEERRKLFEALSESYRFLSSFARRHSGTALISRDDLTVLGRKLYSAFEHKAGKVELLNRGFGAQLLEHQLSLHEVTEVDGAGGWALYRGSLRPEEVRKERPVKRFRFIAELVAWGYFNGVMDQSSQIVVYARRSRLTGAEVTTMLTRMHSIFPDRATLHGRVHDYHAASRVVQALLFVNAGVDPLEGQEGEGNTVGGDVDALSYGSSGENLVVTLDYVVVTSWREVLTFHHSGSKGLMKCLCDCLEWAPLSGSASPVVPVVIGGGRVKDGAIARRVEELFRDVVKCYYMQRHRPTTRYIVRMGEGYHALTLEGDRPQSHALAGHAALMGYLGAALKVFSPVVFDPYAHTDKVLPTIFDVNCPGVVQFFYRPFPGKMVDIYVVDERGSLFYRRAPFHHADALLGQYGQFFDAVLNRVNLMQEGRNAQIAEGLEFYSVVSDGGHLRLQRQPPPMQKPGFQYLSLQVIVEADGEGNPSFTFYCNGLEFTSTGEGARALEAVVRYVLDARRDGQHYPIHITDISVSPSVLGEGGTDRVQTVHFLNYKRHIEEKLNQAMGPGPRLKRSP